MGRGARGLVPFEHTFEYEGRTYTLFGDGFYDLGELAGPHGSPSPEPPCSLCSVRYSSPP